VSTSTSSQIVNASPSASRTAGEREHDRLLLERTEGRLPFLAEDLRNRLARRGLDEVVGVDAAELTGGGGLARAHEADDRDVLLQIRSR
jgi:hypothetical protein